MAKKQPAAAVANKPTKPPEIVDPKVNKYVKEVFQIREQHRTWRCGIICLLLAIATWKISDAVVKISAQPTPEWVTIVGLVLAAIGAWAIPPMTWAMKLRAYFKRDHERTIELEAAFDQERQTSGIKKDGTAPHDDI